MLILFQIIFIVFALYAVFSVWQRKKDGILSARCVSFWIAFWLVVALAVLWPNSTQVLADLIGIGRGADLVIYVSIVLLFFLIFKLHIKLEKINRDITKVVRDKALKQENKKT